MMVIILMVMTTQWMMAIPKEREKDPQEEAVKLEEVVVKRGAAFRE